MKKKDCFALQSFFVHTYYSCSRPYTSYRNHFHPSFKNLQSFRISMYQNIAPTPTNYDAVNTTLQSTMYSQRHFSTNTPQGLARKFPAKERRLRAAVRFYWLLPPLSIETILSPDSLIIYQHLMSKHLLSSFVKVFINMDTPVVWWLYWFYWMYWKDHYKVITSAPFSYCQLNLFVPGCIKTFFAGVWSSKVYSIPPLSPHETWYLLHSMDILQIMALNKWRIILHKWRIILRKWYAIICKISTVCKMTMILLCVESLLPVSHTDFLFIRIGAWGRPFKKS